MRQARTWAACLTARSVTPWISTASSGFATIPSSELGCLSRVQVSSNDNKRGCLRHYRHVAEQIFPASIAEAVITEDYGKRLSRQDRHAVPVRCCGCNRIRSPRQRLTDGVEDSRRRTDDQY